MENHTDIWFGVLAFLEDGSVASVGGTCQKLSLVARQALTWRARHYLRSNNPWVHGLYPVPGYYGPRADGGNEAQAVLWERYECEHHRRLFLGRHCACK